MKKNLMKWSLGLGGALALGVILQGADALVTFAAKSTGSKVTIEGTSTIHDWKVEGAIISGLFEIDPAFQADKSLKSVASLLGKDKAPNVRVRIPVTSLHSQVAVASDTMDGVMKEAMRAKENPAILYRLTQMAVKGEVPASGSPVKFDTKGELAVSGVTNTIDMEVTLERVEENLIKFTGTKALKMSDFKIVPPAPKLALGAIKTGDEVTIKFVWMLSLRTNAPAAK